MLIVNLGSTDPFALVSKWHIYLKGWYMCAPCFIVKPFVIALCIGVGCVPWHVWRSEHSFVESVIPVHLHVGSKDGPAPVARLAQQVSLPADPHHLPSALVFENGSLIEIELIWLDWLTSKPWGASCSGFLSAGITSMCHCTHSLHFTEFCSQTSKGCFFFLDWIYWKGLESNIANTLHIHLWGLTPLYFSIHISDFI